MTRAYRSHANCVHPRTPAGRAGCRAAETAKAAGADYRDWLLSLDVDRFTAKDHEEILNLTFHLSGIAVSDKIDNIVSLANRLSKAYKGKAATAILRDWKTAINELKEG